MGVIRATIHGVQAPAAALARFSDLSLDRVPLLRTQPARIFCHSRVRFEFPYRIGKLPAMPVLHPAPDVARQPRAVGDPRKKQPIRSSKIISLAHASGY